MLNVFLLLVYAFICAPFDSTSSSNCCLLLFCVPLKWMCSKKCATPEFSCVSLLLPHLTTTPTVTMRCEGEKCSVQTVIPLASLDWKDGRVTVSCIGTSPWFTSFDFTRPRSFGLLIARFILLKEPLIP